MITKTQKKQLKKIIGPWHINQILKYLNDNEIKNRDNAEYSGDFVSRVFNGRVENKKIEDHIWEFAAVRKKEDEQKKERRKRLLKEYKSE